MIGSSGLLALWMIAALPSGSTVDVEQPLGALARSIQRDNDNYEWPRTKAQSAAPLPPPRQSPYDALLGKVDSSEAVATDEEEGIPGLPTEKPAEQPQQPPPAKTDKPAPQQEKTAAPKADLPPQKLLKQPTMQRPAPQSPPEKPLPPPEEPTRIPPVPDAPPPQSDDIGEAIISDQDSFEPRFGRRLFSGDRQHLRTWFDDVCYEGWLDQGVTINPQSPADKSNFPVGFNNRANEYQLNQLYLRLLRDVDLDGDAWDVGGRVDLLYGTDWSYVAARGLENQRDLSPKWNSQQYGLAMPQCYMEAFFPWSGGMSVKLGHFYSILGYENVAAVENFFYSHSYARLYAEPYTETGALATKTLGEFTVQAGFSRGDNNWEDNNNALGFLGGVNWKNPNGRTNLSLNVNSGREQPDPATAVRTVYSLVWQQKIGRRWESVVQHDFGAEPNAGVNDSMAKWYGLTQYLFYDINDRWRAGLRFEWFRDQGGSRVPGAYQTADYFELCPGINFTPNKRLVVRSEVRWDWSGTAGYTPFDDGTRGNQVLWSLDAIVRF